MNRKYTAPQRGVFASFAFLLISMMPSGQAWAQDFNDGVLTYTTKGANTVEVTGQVGTLTVIVIPATVSPAFGSPVYDVTRIGKDAFNSNKQHLTLRLPHRWHPIAAIPAPKPAGQRQTNATIGPGNKYRARFGRRI